MDGGYEISSASDDEPMRKLFLLLSPVYFGFQKETGDPSISIFSIKW